MLRTRFLQVATIAAILLAPGIAFAGTPANPGYFSGIGNLWGGATRSDGAPPGCVPGAACGQMAHHYGVVHQQYGTSNAPHRWTKQGIEALAK